MSLEQLVIEFANKKSFGSYGWKKRKRIVCRVGKAEYLRVDFYDNRQRHCH